MICKSEEIRDVYMFICSNKKQPVISEDQSSTLSIFRNKN